MGTLTVMYRIQNFSFQFTNLRKTFSGRPKIVALELKILFTLACQ
jgi:hypothetical protein